MTFLEKIKQKQADVFSARPITLAFLGDSVTQGCFEILPAESVAFKVVYDTDAVYHNQIKRIFAMLYPSLPVNIINAGIGGDNAPGGLKRLERDVLSYKPDLTVVCFGLNDSGGGIDGIERYTNALSEIFIKIKESGSSVIFLTPNMIGTHVNDTIVNPKLRELTKSICTEEFNKSLDEYMNSARKLCSEMNVPVCDCYALWKVMESAGVDTTALLSNDINHPTRELHFMFAYELVKMMLSGAI